MSNISKAWYKSWIEITLNLHENDDEKVKEKKVRKKKTDDTNIQQKTRL